MTTWQPYLYFPQNLGFYVLVITKVFRHLVWGTCFWWMQQAVSWSLRISAMLYKNLNQKDFPYKWDSHKNISWARCSPSSTHREFNPQRKIQYQIRLQRLLSSWVSKILKNDDSVASLCSSALQFGGCFFSFTIIIYFSFKLLECTLLQFMTIASCPFFVHF